VGGLETGHRKPATPGSVVRNRDGDLSPEMGDGRRDCVAQGAGARRSRRGRRGRRGRAGLVGPAFGVVLACGASACAPSSASCGKPTRGPGEARPMAGFVHRCRGSTPRPMGTKERAPHGSPAGVVGAPTTRVAGGRRLPVRGQTRRPQPRAPWRGLHHVRLQRPAEGGLRRL